MKYKTHHVLETCGTLSGRAYSTDTTSGSCLIAGYGKGYGHYHRSGNSNQRGYGKGAGTLVGGCSVCGVDNEPSGGICGCCDNEGYGT